MPTSSIDDGRMLKNLSKRRLSSGSAGKGTVMYWFDPLKPFSFTVHTGLTHYFLQLLANIIAGPQLRVRTEKLFFLISQPKHMLWVLKRTVSLRRL